MTYNGMETQSNLEVDKSSRSAGFFFLSLGSLVTLITSAVSFLNLMFNTLNKRFPDVLNAIYQYGYSTYDHESIRMALATLIIFFPIFLVVSYFWEKYAKSGMRHADETIKKWLIYVILFLSASVAAVDLVTLVRYFVSGEITIRFTLKVTAVLVVTLFIGVYYIFELRKKEKMFGFKIGFWFAIKSGVLVSTLVIWSFTVIGTPGQQRIWRLDERRVQDLQNIQYQVINYWQQKEKLPERLSDLANPLSGYSLPIDPEFGKGNIYEYKVDEKNKSKFELCATFTESIPKGWREYGNGDRVVPMPYYSEKDIVVSYPYPSGGVNESWDYEAGRTCFERTIDKDIYPPFPKSLTR